MTMHIAHTLFLDVVGYSALRLEEQARQIAELTRAAQATETFRRATAAGRVVALPTGDGMALVFDDDVTSPAACAVELLGALAGGIRLRVGIHSGLVQAQTDIKGGANVVGEGINTAQRVMDFADPGQILLSEQHARWLRESPEWKEALRPVGTGVAKHGLTLTLYALTRDGWGSAAVPERLTAGRGDEPAGAEPAPARPVATEQAPDLVLLYRRGGKREEGILAFIEEQLTAQGFAVYRDRNRTFRPGWAEETREKLRGARAVLALISPESRQSEMLPWELEQARERHDETGKPQILPLYVGDQEEANDDVGRYVRDLPRFVWSGPEDNHRLLTEIVSAIRGPLTPTGTAPLEPVGGAVPLDSAFYIPRAADAELLTAVDAGESILLVPGPRQVGKTSLLARAADHARNRGARVVQTDFQQLNASQLRDEERFYRGLAGTVARQCKFAYDFGAEWDEFLAPNENLNYFIEALVGDADTPLVWCLDEADKMFPAPFASDFFGLVRSWHNARASRPDGPWRRLTILIAYATEARLFIRDLNQSPFNVGRKLELADFTLDQFQILNARYGDPLTPPECGAVHALLAGQPFLSRRALDVVATGRNTPASLLADARRDDGPFADHLQRLLLGVTEIPAVTAFVRAALAGTATVAGDTPAYDRLHSAGVLRQARDGSLEFRCPLYRQFLEAYLGAT
jgi:hypothetical protein